MFLFVPDDWRGVWVPWDPQQKGEQSIFILISSISDIMYDCFDHDFGTISVTKYPKAI